MIISLTKCSISYTKFVYEMAFRTRNSSTASEVAFRQRNFRLPAFRLAEIPFVYIRAGISYTILLFGDEMLVHFVEKALVL